MMQDAPIRLYATFKSTPNLLSIYRRKDLPELTRLTVQLLSAAQGHQTRAAPQPSSPHMLPDFHAVSAPSLDWRAAFAEPRAREDQRDSEIAREIVPDVLIIAFDVRSAADARSFLGIVNPHRHIPLDAYGNAFLGAGLDPGGSINNHWCPGSANFGGFGHRDHANRVINAGALTGHALTGQTVNVVVIDEGLDKAVIQPANWGGGLDHYLDTGLILRAGSAPRNSHGMMIARSILNLAPNARLYDVPVIPPTITESLPIFVSMVHAAYSSLIHEINHRRTQPQWSGPWVLVNAWGIFDTTSDPFGSYTRNTEPFGHPLINLVTQAVQQHHLDIIFAAGNCGEYCPSQTCGALDRGSGHGIWGANAHPLVITAGAIRADETWIGYSSQGPGPELLAIQKPDLCGPSQFYETYDAALLSSGTSAACAMTAGVVAALRSNPVWDQVSVPPQALKSALIASARKPHGPPGWDNRLGFGILDTAATIFALPP